MTEPTVYVDFEIGLDNGHTLFQTCQEGVDRKGENEAELTLHLNPGTDSEELLTIKRASVAYMRTTKRVVQPEVTTQDAGSIRLIGGSDGR